jgi:addiction module HigA family antidote
MAMKNPPHPGELIRHEILAPLKLSVTEAAEILRVTRPALSRMLNGRSALTPEMALRVEKAFGPKMDHLMGMQLAHDLARTRGRADEIKVERFALDRASRH